MATNDKQLEKNLSEQYKNLSKQINTSPTAYAAGVPPTTKDVNLELDLAQVKKQREQLENARLEKRWYGTETKESDIERDEGLLMRALHTITMPLYATVGAAEAVLGKGTEKGLANIPANVKERGLFGDLLRQYNLPTAAAAPLGFAMDVAFDPLTWLTLGTSALVPRVAVGATKGLAKGAIKGAESGFLRHATTAGRFIPGVKGTSKYKGLVKKAVESSAEYDKIIGRDFAKELGEKGSQSFFGMPKLGNVLENKINNHSWGDQAIEFLKYKNKEWFKNEMMMDDLLKAEREAGYVMIGGRTREEVAGKLLSKLQRDQPDFDFVNKLDKSSIGIKASDLTQEGASMNRAKGIIDEGADIATDKVAYSAAEGSDNLQLRMGGESILEGEWRDLVDFQKGFSSNRSGVDWMEKNWDNFKDTKIGKSKFVKDTFAGYQKFINIFKISKVGLTPTAYLNAVVGNATMTWMEGINPFAPAFMNSVRNSWKVSGGKPSAEFITGLLQDVGWEGLMKNYPGLFKKSFKFNPDFLVKSNAVEDMIVAFKEATPELENIGKYADDIQDVMNSRNQLLNDTELGNLVTGKLEKGAAKIEGVATEAARARPGQMPGVFEGTTTTTLSSEIYRGEFNKFLGGLQEKGKTNAFYKFAHSYLTKPMDLYERVDLSYKLGFTNYLSRVGITEAELSRVGRLVDILPENIKLDKATNLWKIEPLKAVEIAHDTYMNYMAMPGAVKVLRTTPFLGAPFASFMYGMAVKTGKTALNNPAAFSRVEAFLGEFSGKPSPLERKAMELPYYQWYKDSGMVKLPFGEKHSAYLNVGNLIPYYTMNMFQPSERKYENTLIGNISGLVDKMPFLKTPEGQVIFDYFIQPLILGSDEVPQSMFGQPLWPQDATVAEKVGLATRTGVESVVPGVAGLAGLIGGPAVPELTPYVPSYRYRNIAQATQGKSAIGITTNENSVARTLRSLSASLGLPYYPLNTEYVESQIKKELK